MMSELPTPLTTHHSPLIDHSFLLHAHRLAERGLGRTAPNPTVGCVIVKNNYIVGAARTADGGRPHAEALALAQAGDAARGATAYVTLEPCAHHGKTPPCAEALIAAGIARVVIGTGDPDPRVAGRGIAMLQAAGIEVLVPHPHLQGGSMLDAGEALSPCGGGQREARVRGCDDYSEPPHPPASGPLPLPQGERASPATLLQHHLHDLNRGFFRRVTTGMPYVAMKLATSTDFFMARSDDGGQWLTGAFARQHGHLIRSQHDCILTGIGTVLADDPLLTVRPPIAPHPALVRVVVDRQLRIPLTSKLVNTANQFPLTVITTTEAVEHAASHATDLTERGVKLIALEEVTPQSILRVLAAEGLTRVLIEAGPMLSATFLASGLVDTLHYYRAPFALGNAGAAQLNALEGHLLASKRAETRVLGEDTYEHYELIPGFQ